MLPPDVLFLEAVQVLMDKCANLKRELDSMGL